MFRFGRGFCDGLDTNICLFCVLFESFLGGKEIHFKGENKSEKGHAFQG